MDITIIQGMLKFMFNLSLIFISLMYVFLIVKLDIYLDKKIEEKIEEKRMIKNEG